MDPEPEPEPERSSEDRSNLDTALDVFVYAPVGLAFEMRSLIPRLAERGRSQVDMARAVGRFAVSKGRDDVENVLKGMGVVSGDEEEGEPTSASQARAARPERPVRPVPDIDVDRLAIPGYDTLSASQVVPRLASLDSEELELVRRYEAMARGRKTILSKIAQLQSAG